MKTKELSIVATLALLVPLVGFANGNAEVQKGDQPQTKAKRFSTFAAVSVAGQLSSDPASSKFNEYRDIRDGIFVPDLKANVYDNQEHRYLELLGSNLFRDDQNINARAGKYGRYRLDFEWDKIRHLLSNKAKTPYNYQGNGTYTVPATVLGLVTNLAPTAPQMLENDGQIATYLNQYLHSTDLENSRNKQKGALEYSLFDGLKFLFNFSNEDRDGNKITYGPIGDRPPRTLNIQMLEPIDYKTRELRFEADYVANRFQANASYFLSDFKDHIDALTWQNIFTTPGPTFRTWGTGASAKSVGTFGKRPLPPSNRAHTGTFTFGVDLPKNSRLNGNVAYTTMRQNNTLLPYSTVSTTDGGIAWNDTSKLPRNTAQGRIDTKLYELLYLISPVDRLNVRAKARFYDLDNRTPEASWKYVTQDTVNETDGSVAYVNKRKNVPYEYDQRNYLVDADYAINFWRSIVGAGIEREAIHRRHREGNTKENIYQLYLRSHPKSGMNFRLKYKFGKRDIGSYDTHAAAETYDYAPSEATDNNDPQFSFENHPDTRLFDLTDRKRHLFEAHANVNPTDKLDLGGVLRLRFDDFDSGVTPTMPLANYAGSRPITPADRAAQTPGDQLGLLKNHRQQYGLDASYIASNRLTFTAFATYDQGQTRQRGFEFDENQKARPTLIASTTELGPWTRRTMQWTAKITDRTFTGGVGAKYAIIPDKLKATGDLVLSSGRVHLLYAGFGTVSSVTPSNTLADDYQFAFRTPSSVRQNRTTTKLNLEYQFVKNLSVALGYLFEYYRLSDWQQEANTPWRESVSTENLTRDTSRSNQWGNRLVNLGSYLAPSYHAHAGTLSLIFKN